MAHFFSYSGCENQFFNYRTIFRDLFYEILRDEGMFTTLDSRVMPKKVTFTLDWSCLTGNSIFAEVSDEVLHIYVSMRRENMVDLDFFLNKFSNLTFSSIFGLRK